MKFKIPTHHKTFLGWPISWFEECSYLVCEGLALKDGSLWLPGQSGYSCAFRMKDKYRKRAGW